MSHAHVPDLTSMRRSTSPHLGVGGLRLQTVRADDTRAVLAVEGELDLANADLLAGILSHHVQHGRRYLRLDLSQVGFIDCAGLTALVQAHNELVSIGGQLVLTDTAPSVARLLRLTHLDEALYVADRHDGPPRLRRPCHLSPVSAE